MKLAALRLPFSRRLAASSLRGRILAWAAIICLVVGALEIGEPVDLFVQAFRDKVRLHASDGNVIVARIDNRAIAKLKSWPAARVHDANVIDNLFALGARRVFYDRTFTDPSAFGDDEALAAAIRRHSGRVYLAARYQDDRTTGQRNSVLPVEPLRSAARLGSIVVWMNLLGYTDRIPFMSQIDGRLYPSFSAIIANKYAYSTDTFRPDYSIDYRTVPSLSLADVLNRTSRASLVQGKDVIIGVTEPSLGDVHRLPGQGLAPGVFVWAISAETLRHGMPVQLGWMPFYLFAVALGAIYLTAKQRQLRWLVVATGGTLLFVVPILLDGRNIESEVAPAALLLVIVVVRARILARVVSNPVTGLPKLDQLLRGETRYAETLIGLKIRNLADLRSALTTQEEASLYAEMVRRVRVGNSDLEVMQHDDSLIWMTNMDACEKLLGHVEALHAMMALPFDLGSRRVDLSVAFGIDADTDRELVNRVGSVLVSADDALASGERWKIHDPRRLDDADFRLSLLSRMDSALENGEIWVAYQPKLDLKRRGLCGTEALVRWSHPERGLIPPDRFIPEAEAANRIAGLTAFVLETAIRDTASLDAVDPEFGVAVNLSVRMLGNAGFVESVAALLKKYRLAAHRLTLEVTESAEIDFASKALATLWALRDLGVKLSIDDYGTKYSTLDYVRQLPASEIKIDQRFIRSMHLDENARIMAQSTIELAHSLGLTVVAEGVELPVTMAALTDMGCDVLQGYLIGKPRTFDTIRRFVSYTKLPRMGLAA